MKNFKDICYSDFATERNKLDLYIPDCEEFPVFVYFHSGGIESGGKEFGGKEMGEYLAPYKIVPMDVAGFVFDGPQPTTHFNVLREKGIDSRRVIIDEAAPLYHFGISKEYPPMTFIVATNDMSARFEQVQLCLASLKHFGCDESKYDLQVFEGTHGKYKTTWIAEVVEKFVSKYI